MISSSAAPASPLGCGLARSAGVELDVVVRKMRVRVCQIAGRTGGATGDSLAFGHTAPGHESTAASLPSSLLTTSSGGHRGARPLEAIAGVSQRIRYTGGWSGENRRITTDDHRATSRADDAVSQPCHTLRTVAQCNNGPTHLRRAGGANFD